MKHAPVKPHVLVAYPLRPRFMDELEARYTLHRLDRDGPAVLDAAGGLIAVLDVDATAKAAFDAVDQQALERLMAKVFAGG